MRINVKMSKIELLRHISPLINPSPTHPGQQRPKEALVRTHTPYKNHQLKIFQNKVVSLVPKLNWQPAIS
jgi:hypothetical protein